MPQKIAVIGISTELPSGTWSDRNLDHNAFFDFLLNKGEAYERIPPERFNIDAWKGDYLGQVGTETGAFLKGAASFDNVEFGVSAKDARTMSPSTRKLIEHCFLALLDSGIDYRSRNVGCFTSGITYGAGRVSDHSEYNVQGSFAGIPSMIANRVSYHLDLLGPSVPTDTACSSSCTALHLAVNALSCDDCETAVVAGCQLNHEFLDWFTYSQGSVLAKDGKCKPFDASADGFSRAEGVVAIVLKPLEQALEDGDRIYGTILGSSINAGGSAAPPSAPVPDAQYLAMKKAFQRAGRSPTDVDYVECHATGTATGDPAEVNWVGKHFSREDLLLLGSVKGNIGHTEITSFLASLSKVLSMFKYRMIPPNVNLETRNPRINWEHYKLRVPTVATPLPCRSGTRSLVGIASSGIGGSNAHVVLEGPENIDVPDVMSTGKPVLLMSGGLSPRSAGAMSDSLSRLATTSFEFLDGLAVKLGRRARQMTWRTFAIADITNIQQLRFPEPSLCPRMKPSVVFVFSGQGPQHFDMGRELFDTFSHFRDSILKCDAIYKLRTGQSLVHDFGLFQTASGHESIDVWPIELTLPAIAIFQIAIFDLLVFLGVKPDAIVGHSAGETSAVYASGAGSKALTIDLAIARGRAFSSIEKLGGTMAALSCSASKAMALMDLVNSGGSSSHPCEIACYNSPSAVAIAGPAVKVDQVLKLATLEGIFCRKIKTQVPVHSSMIEECRELYLSLVKEVFTRYPDAHYPVTPTYSTFTGTIFQSTFDTDYFWKNARNPVLFTRSMNAIIRDHPDAVFVEISPHPILSAYVSEISLNSHQALHSGRRPTRNGPLVEHRTLLQLLGELTVAGYNNVNFARVHHRENANFDLPIQLPEYPFQPKSFPVHPSGPGYAKQIEDHNGPLNHRYLKLNKDTHPSLAEHIVRGEPIMPAAGFLETAFEFGATALMNVNFRSILSLSSDKPVEISVVLDNAYWSISSRVGKDTTAHADGYLSYENIPPSVPFLDIQAIKGRCNETASDSFYPILSYFLQYGPRFRRVMEVDFNSNEALVKIRGDEQDLDHDHNYRLHPAILDACFHVACFRPFHGNYDPNAYYLPARVRSIVLHQPPRTKYFPSLIYAHQVLRKWTPDALIIDITISDASGRCLCSILEIEAARHFLSHPPDISRRLDIIYQSASLPGNSLTLGRINDDDALDTSSFTGLVMESSLDNNEAVERHASAQGLQILHQALFSLAQVGSKRVVNIFVAGLEPTFYPRLEELFAKYPSLFVTYFVCGSVHDALDLSSEFATGQIGTFNFAETIESQGIAPHMFDILLCIGIAGTSTASPTTLLQRVHELLIHEGRLLLIEYDSLVQQQLSQAASSVAVDSDRHDMGNWTNLLASHGFECLASHQNTCCSGIFALEGRCIVALDATASSKPFDEEAAHLIWYEEGQEMDLQWTMSGLDPSQRLEVWITAFEGVPGDEAMGLARALRREYLNWKFWVVVFPSSYTEVMRMDILRNLPSQMKTEPEIVILPRGDAIVPRIAPIIPRNMPFPRHSNFTSPQLPSHHTQVQIAVSCLVSHVRAFVGSVVNDNSSLQLHHGALVFGLTADMSSQDSIVIDSGALHVLPSSQKLYIGDELAACIPGLAVAALAPTPSAYKDKQRMKSLRVLLTHSNSTIGKIVHRLYKALEVDVVEVDEHAGLYDLCCLDRSSFDLIVSGYQDTSSSQMLTLLLKDSGKIFFWDRGDTALSTLVKKEPWIIGDALQCSLVTLCERSFPPMSVGLDSRECQARKVEQIPTIAPNIGVSFRSDRSYLLLGGLGSLGPHIALWMYERGARHIIITSRNCEASLAGKVNTLPRRIIRYLQERDDLVIQLEQFDASSKTQLSAFLQKVSPPLAGSIILTASTSDGLFSNLQDSDFALVRESSVKVFDALQQTLAIEKLDFLVNFSSVSATFGNAGQANYCCTKTVVDGMVRRYKNAFSFICPPIAGTKLVDTVQHNRKGTLLSWQESVEDMLLWLEDAMRVHDSGENMWLYIPDWNWSDLNRALGTQGIGSHLSTTKTITTASINPVDKSARLLEILLKHLDILPEDISQETPLTTYGLDSLSASRLSFALDNDLGLKISQIQLLANTSLGDLQSRLSCDVEESDDSNSHTSDFIRVRDEMLELLSRYTSSNGKYMNPPKSDVFNSAPHIGRTILVTGTTGALGSHILDALHSSPDVRMVYALNRPSKDIGLLQRQKMALESQGLSASIAESSKVCLLEFDMGAPNLGLSDPIVDELLHSVTHIIHNAWQSDFMSQLPAFESLLQGTRALIDLALHSKLQCYPTYTFISSIGVCRFNQSSSEPAEEPISAAMLQQLEKMQLSDSSGYIQSKWIAEGIMDYFSRTTSLRISVVRVGQLSGGRNGAWDIAQWVPAMIKSGLYVGCLPGGDDVVSWLPVVTAAKAIVDILGTEGTIHVVHPRPVAWQTLMDSAAFLLQVPLVPYHEWFSSLQASMQETSEQRRISGGNSALKLIDFFRQGIQREEHSRSATDSMGLLPKVVAEKGKRESTTLGDTAQLGREDVELWIGYWRECGFLPPVTI